MKRISYTDLPVSAFNKISKRQQSYIDEFEFFLLDGGFIEARYAGDIFTWDGRSWN